MPDEFTGVSVPKSEIPTLEQQIRQIVRDELKKREAADKAALASTLEGIKNAVTR